MIRWSGRPRCGSTGISRPAADLRRAVQLLAGADASGDGLGAGLQAAALALPSDADRHRAAGRSPVRGLRVGKPIGGWIASLTGFSDAAGSIRFLAAVVFASGILCFTIYRGRAPARAFARRKGVPGAGPGQVDLARAPRNVLKIALEIVILLVIAMPLLAFLQPFLPRFPGAVLLLAALVLAGISFWRRAANLEGHVKAVSQVIVESLASRERPGTRCRTRRRCGTCASSSRAGAFRPAAAQGGQLLRREDDGGDEHREPHRGQDPRRRARRGGFLAADRERRPEGGGRPDPRRNARGGGRSAGDPDAGARAAGAPGADVR